MFHRRQTPPSIEPIGCGGIGNKELGPLKDGDVMHLIWMIVIGFIAGVVAKLLVPGRDPGGFIITACLGIAGALLAGWLGRVLGFYQENQNAGFIASVIGAVIILGIYHLIRRARTH